MTPADRRRAETAAERSLPFTLAILGTTLLFAYTNAAADPPTGPPPKAASVGEVTATAGRTERNVLETAGHVTVLERSDIETSGAKNVAELLRREPGVLVTNSTSTRGGYEVEVRGFQNGSGGGSSLLVLVDGRRINEPETSVTDWGLIPLDNIERVEIVRGPASALYGDNAVGGVVEITTRSGEGPPRATVTGRLGKYRTKEGSAWAGGSAGPVALSVFFDHFETGGYRDQSNFRSRDFQGRTDIQLGDSASLSLRGGYVTNDRPPPGPLNELELDADRQQVDPDSIGSDAIARRRFVDGTLTAQPAEGVTLSAQGYYTRRNDSTVAPSAAGLFSRGFETQALGLNGKAQFDWQGPGETKLRTIIGLDLLREDRKGADTFVSAFNPLFNSDSKRRSRKDSVGAYLQAELEVLSWLLLTAGYRHDRADYEINDVDRITLVKQAADPTHTLHTPRFGIVARATETTSVYASWARGFRLPNLGETGGVFANNPNIDPQRSKGIEVGVKHRSERLRANLALYRMDVRDEILLDSEVIQFGFFGLQTVNMDRVRHQGLEVSWSFDLFPALELHGGYTWDDTRIRRDSTTNLDGKRVPITPEHRGSLGVLARGPWGLEAGVDVQFVGRRYGVNDFGHRLDQLQDYRRWDVHLGWRPKLGEHVELGFTFDLLNASNRRYEETGGRPSFVAVGATAVPGFFPAPRRHYIGGVSVTVRR